MKNKPNILKLIFVFFVATTLLACTQNADSIVEPKQETTQTNSLMLRVATDSLTPTRTSYEHTEGITLSATWDSSDKILVIGEDKNKENVVEQFSMVGGSLSSDKKQASFHNKNSLIKGRKCLIVYPYNNYTQSTDKKTINFDFSHQTGKLVDMKNYDIMTSYFSFNDQQKGSEYNYIGSRIPKLSHKLLSLCLKIDFKNTSLKGTHVKQIRVVGGATKFSLNCSYDKFGEIEKREAGIVYITPQNNDNQFEVQSDGTLPNIYVRMLVGDEENKVSTNAPLGLFIELDNGDMYFKGLGYKGSKTLSPKDGMVTLKIYPKPQIHQYVFSDGSVTSIKEYYKNHTLSDGHPIAWVVDNRNSKETGFERANYNIAQGATNQAGVQCTQLAIALTDVANPTLDLDGLNKFYGDEKLGYYQSSKEHPETFGDAQKQFAWKNSIDKTDNYSRGYAELSPEDVDLKGYEYTWSKDKSVSQEIKGDNKNFPAFYAAGTIYPAQGNNNGTTKEPQNCSKWFLPSMSQWALFFMNNLNVPCVPGTRQQFYALPTYQNELFVTLFNDAMNEVVPGTTHKVGEPMVLGFYACSTEATKNIPVQVFWGRYEDLTLTRLQITDKGMGKITKTTGFRVRPFIAF